MSRAARVPLLLAIAACGPATPPATIAGAPPPPPPSAVPAAASSAPVVAPPACEALATLSLPHVTITEARSFPASAASSEAPALPASCRVHGISRPTPDSEIRFSVAIPAGDAWNGRYVQLGNGGFAGAIWEGAILAQLAAGYSAAGTDDGHQSPPNAIDASWALGHPEKIVDFGHRALKETTDAARALVRAYAGRAPARSYFVGCSDGGREALMEAQRYPDDFDGIVAGAPANHWTHIFYGAAWISQALLETPQSYVPKSKLPALQAAALAACGDEDHVIEDPFACRFDPGVLRCKGIEDDRCLSDAQIKAVRAIYSGPRPKGARPTSAPLVSGYEPGSEADEDNWVEWMVGTGPGADGHAAIPRFAEQFFRYMVFGDASYDVRTFRFDVDVATTDAKVGPILDSFDPDLGAFRKHGGKLIVYHGWGDAAVPPRDSIAYHDAVLAKMGDPSSFYRLFMAPGMLHCGGGAGPNVLETLPAITDWVENGKAPDELLASKMDGEGPAAKVVRTRPLCPYPQRAQWDKKGDRSRAESYACVAAPRSDAPKRR